MPIVIAPQLTQRTYFWSAWKTVFSVKGAAHQHDDDGSTYTIWFYDGPEVHICTIWKGEVPSGVIEAGVYSQEQNDADKAEFEAAYLSSSNQTLVPKAATGVVGQAPGKGLGGWAPDPMTDPYGAASDEVVSHYIDVAGALVTRGQTLTDEGSIRDDFVGTSLFTELSGEVTFTNGSNVVTGSGTLFNDEVTRDHYIKLTTDDDTKWALVGRSPNDTVLYLFEPYEGSSGTGTAHTSRWVPFVDGLTPGTVSVGSSKLTLSPGTTSTGVARVEREGDYLPMVVTWAASISQRITNQSAHFGFRDDCESPSMLCEVVLDGTDNTKVKFRSAWKGDEELTQVSLPAGLTTAQTLRYKIDVSTDYCALLVNGVMIARHENHVPDMYATMFLCAGISNTSSVGSSTDLAFDTMFWSNQDQVQVASIFQAPIPVITREDQHCISAKKTTVLTTANQTLVSYTVPAGKVFYIIGYKIDTSGTTAGVIKIGRNDLSSEPAAPGSVDDNIFRAFELIGGGTTGEVDFGGNPRKLGVGGDTILITVTPLAALSTTWRASLDFVLR
jgi:hypothetical protein